MLNSEQTNIIKDLKKEADIVVRKNSPNLASMLAGTALSNGGDNKIIELLDQFFSDLYETAEKLPDEFSMDIKPELLSEVDAKALGYIFLDQFRPTLGLTILPSSTAKKKEFHALMDKRILYAAANLKKVRSVIGK